MTNEQQHTVTTRQVANRDTAESGAVGSQQSTISPIVNNKFYELFTPATHNEGVIKKARTRPLSKINYVICITPRSGSSWLCDVLQQKGIGRPGEYINAQLMSGPLAKTGAGNVDEYFDIMRRVLVTNNGVFGLKASWFQLALVLQGTTLEKHFGDNLHFIALSREDFVLQGISLYLSVKTDYFHSVQPNVTEDKKREYAELEYDGTAIRSWIDHILKQEHGFEEYFKTHGIKPLRLKYENSTTAPRKTLVAVCDFIGLDKSLMIKKRVTPRHEKLGTDRNTEWAARFRSENAEYVEKWEKMRGIESP